MSPRAALFAVIAVVSVLLLIDSELLAYGVPGIVAGFELLHLPTVLTYAAIGALVLLVLVLSVWLARQVWRVERSLDAAGKEPSASC
jgi:hypothetical protein